MPAAAELVRLVHDGAVGRPRMVAMREHRFPFLTKVGHWNRFARQHRRHARREDVPLLRPDEPHRRGAPDAGDGVGRPGRQPPRRGRTTGGPPTCSTTRSSSSTTRAGPRAMLDLCMFAEATHNQEEMSVVGAARQGRGADPGRTRSASAVAASTGSAASSRTASRTRRSPTRACTTGRATSSTSTSSTPSAPAAAEVTLDDGLWSVAMGVAAHRSIELGRPVELSEVLPDSPAPTATPPETIA